MRPHVELIDEKDLIWHVAELPHGVGAARQRHLNYCEEKGEASLSVEFTSDWSRPAGCHAAQTEWFVLEGELTLGEQAMTKDDYFMAPAGVLTPALHVKAGTRVLLFREFGDWGFTPASQSEREGELVVMRASQMAWFDITDPHNGSPMDFSRGGTPVPGLSIKLLYHNKQTGFYTRLIRAKADWVEHPLAHHPCYEEAYCLDGSFEYNYGSMWPGTYFFRPAGVRHGDFKSGPTGTTWLLRCDGRLVDWYTEGARVEMQGKALNWGPEYPGTEPPVLLQPTRSRSIGPMKDPAYQ
ncbi:DUF4437 domain-containing protein [Inhella sp.]|uniref:DUF4437 domain-containing protein n=1 Tax=Inhella sp. TaxID=1921806 RepID=UPI0035B4D9B2